MLNPKALAYFGSIFVLVVPPNASIGVRCAAVAVVGADATFWYGLAAVLFSMPAVRKGYLALRRPIDRICGTIMIAFGAKLMMART